MGLHSTHMKRIVAKEFLLLVGCVVVVLLVAVFAWARNAWLRHTVEKLNRAIYIETDSLLKLHLQASARRLDFVDLFEPKYVRNNHDVFLRTPRWTMDQFMDILAINPFAEFGGEEVHTVDWHKRYLGCTANALKKAGYLTPDRLSRYSDMAGLRQFSGSTTMKPWERAAWQEHNDFAAQFLDGFHDDEHIIDSALEKLGVPRQELLRNAPPDTSTAAPTMLIVYALERDTLPFTELRSAYHFLVANHVLACSFEELLFTLQNKPVPPSQEVLEAVIKKKTTVDELDQALADARTSIWSEAKQWAVVKWAAIVLLVLVYPLRLLVLGTRWALQTLRA